MTVGELKQQLTRFPDHYEVGLYEDEETAGLGICNPEGKATTIEHVIELENV